MRQLRAQKADRDLWFGVDSTLHKKTRAKRIGVLKRGEAPEVGNAALVEPPHIKTTAVRRSDCRAHCALKHVSLCCVTVHCVLSQTKGHRGGKVKRVKHAPVVAYRAPAPEQTRPYLFARPLGFASDLPWCRIKLSQGVCTYVLGFTFVSDVFLRSNPSTADSAAPGLAHAQYATAYNTRGIRGGHVVLALSTALQVLLGRVQKRCCTPVHDAEHLLFGQYCAPACTIRPFSVLAFCCADSRQQTDSARARVVAHPQQRA